ncbi:MAG: hypothetical protein H6Q33_5415 [Deltaproteobacteria bacterium]|nr:hypothetical protein [Deltaproteobacteria bacterium]
MFAAATGLQSGSAGTRYVGFTVEGQSASLKLRHGPPTACLLEQAGPTYGTARASFARPTTAGAGPAACRALTPGGSVRSRPAKCDLSLVANGGSR